MVYLGDLGRDVPAKERSYWKSFNVTPEGRGSDVNFRRSMLAQFTSPTMKDLLFKEHFEGFQNDWFKRYGWDLFNPLSEADRHYAISLRIPLANEQAQFDEQVMALAKILIDSLNESELTKRIPPQPANTRSLKKLEAFMVSSGVDGSSHLKFLHNLWNLRHGTPHRKGEAYQNAAKALGVAERGFIGAFTNILEQAIGLIEFLRAASLTCNDRISDQWALLRHGERPPKTHVGTAYSWRGQTPFPR